MREEDDEEDEVHFKSTDWLVNGLNSELVRNLVRHGKCVIWALCFRYQIGDDSKNAFHICRAQAQRLNPICNESTGIRAALKIPILQ